MYNILNYPSGIVRTEYVDLQRNYIYDQIKVDVDYWITWCRENPRAIPSNHPLSVILYKFDVTSICGDIDPNIDSKTYIDLLNNYCIPDMSLLKLSTPFNKGNVINIGKFYGPGYREVVMADTSSISILDNDWMTWEPVKVLRHPRSDLTLDWIDGRCSSTEGDVVISINIGMLLLQFYKWSTTAGKEASVNEFISAFPMNNAFKSHLDVVVFNRLVNRFNGVGHGVNLRHAPVNFTYANEKKLDDVHDRLLERFSGSYTYEDIMSNTKCVYHGDMYSFYSYNDSIINLQNAWSHCAARLDYINFIVDYCNRNNNVRNQGMNIQIRRMISRIKNGLWLISNIDAVYGKELDNSICNLLLAKLK